MKVVIYSEKHEQKTKIGWYRGGKNIQYYRNGMYKIYKERKKLFSSLSFSYESQYDHDSIYFANSTPYLYTGLLKELNEFEKDDIKYRYSCLLYITYKLFN